MEEQIREEKRLAKKIKVEKLEREKRMARGKGVYIYL